VSRYGSSHLSAIQGSGHDARSARA